MLSSIKVEFYPLWIKDNPELFEVRKEEFYEAAKAAKLPKIEEYWKFGLFYMEASAAE